ncbi:MAG: hypothetical protein R3C20_25050 [Planctomycetaceae bacterium]
MQPIASQCSEELLRLLLADALTEIQEEQIAMHLNGCKTCRSRL